MCRRTTACGWWAWRPAAMGWTHQDTRQRWPRARPACCTAASATCCRISRDRSSTRIPIQQGAPQSPVIVCVLLCRLQRSPGTRHRRHPGHCCCGCHRFPKPSVILLSFPYIYGVLGGLDARLLAEASLGRPDSGVGHARLGACTCRQVASSANKLQIPRSCSPRSKSCDRLNGITASNSCTAWDFFPDACCAALFKGTDFCLANACSLNCSRSRRPDGRLRGLKVNAASIAWEAMAFTSHLSVRSGNLQGRSCLRSQQKTTSTAWCLSCLRL
jgi:hypothetical protein